MEYNLKLSVRAKLSMPSGFGRNVTDAGSETQRKENNFLDPAHISRGRSYIRFIIILRMRVKEKEKRKSEGVTHVARWDSGESALGNLNHRRATQYIQDSGEFKTRN